MYFIEENKFYYRISN